MQRTREKPRSSPRPRPATTSQSPDVSFNLPKKRGGNMAELTVIPQPVIKATRRSSRHPRPGETSDKVAVVSSTDHQGFEPSPHNHSAPIKSANSAPTTRKGKISRPSDPHGSNVPVAIEPKLIKTESAEEARCHASNADSNSSKANLDNDNMKRSSSNSRGRPKKKKTGGALDGVLEKSSVDFLPKKRTKLSESVEPLIGDHTVGEVMPESTEISGNARMSRRARTGPPTRFGKIFSKESPKSKLKSKSSSVLIKKTSLKTPVSPTPGKLTVAADAVAVAEAEKQGVFTTQDSGDFKRARGRPRSSAKESEKSAAKEIVDFTVGPDEEPNICTRCGNQPAGIDHFYRFHNGLLASEQQSFDFPARRKRWTFTVLHKKCKMHCQVLSCRKVLNSVTAMIYHEKICGVQVAKVTCSQCGKSISSLVMRQHKRDHLRVAAELELCGMVEEEVVKVEKNEDEDHSLQGDRRKRPSALAARKKFRSTDDEQEDRQDEGDQEKYQPSGSDDDEEEDLESAVSDEEDSADASADQDDVDQATPSKRRQKDVRSDHLVGSRSTVKFAKLHTLWRRSLEVLGYAKCESDNCDHMATSLSDIVAHFKACRSKQDDRRRLSCAVRACRFRCAIEGRLVRHYIKNHSMNLTKAREMAKEKKEVLPDWRPTQKEIDALRLFD